MPQPLVSFIIAAFNEEKFIVECVESCLNQTYSNIEVCITDDGSTDSTKDILNKKYGHDSRLKIYSFSQNRGKVAAFNRSYQMASGEYIALFGADDVSVSTRIERSLDFLQSKNLDMVWGNMIVCDENLEKQKLFVCRPHPNSITVEKLLEGDFMAGGTLFFNRKISERAFPIPEHLRFEDWWIKMNALLFGRVAYIDAELIYYRQHDANDLGTAMYADVENSIQDMKRHEAYYKEFIRLFREIDNEQSPRYINLALQAWTFRKLVLCKNLSGRLQIFKRDRPALRINSLGLKTILALALGAKIYFLKGFLRKIAGSVFC